MTRKYLLLSLLLVATQSTMTQPDPDLDPCEPDCIDQVGGASVPDPQNCHRYYTSLEDETASDFVTTCPDGEKFDAMTLACSPDFRNVTCGTCEPNCAFDCPFGEITFVASRFNCSEYRLCGMGEQEAIQCPPELPYFDGEECQADPDVCCDPCEVICWSAFTEITDPKDCRGFYFCAEENYFPGEGDRYMCSDGEVFHEGGCVVDDGSVECEEPCG